MSQPSLREIIAAAQTGSADAYAALLARYERRLYGYFFRATGRHHDAEDLLGELLLRLVRRLGRYDHRGRFEPWLFRIAANMVRDRIRRSRTRPAAATLSERDEQGEALVDRLEGSPPPVDGPLLAAEASEQVQAALDRLDEKTRQMILLRHFGEMSFKEIAELFDAPLGTVLARVHRGLKALRRLLGANDDDRM